ncbi:MAG TPA: PhzF family phenazine biosynthesis protein, partial [Noviherbaspirillum sp.]|jgi:PhzF family phenazine biosynthesis protein|uniref:PhzF family phenazine biosynthesis protein n=1 Tax=Noviherbaspirillum sp. TaxID=1926288 RepID=UPI002DDD8265
LKLEFKVGLVDVSAQEDTWTFVAPASGMPETRSTGLPDDFIARMVGLTAADLLESPMWVNTGTDQLLMPVRSVDAVARAQPAGDLLNQWLVSSLGRKTAYVFAFDGDAASSAEVVARYFFTMQGGGVAEDPGTGSACANLGGWLIAAGRPLPRSVQIRQGEAVGRKCTLHLHVSAERRIHVGGRVIELGRGFVDI